jgi:hypothetical protein
LRRKILAWSKIKNILRERSILGDGKNPEIHQHNNIREKNKICE